MQWVSYNNSILGYCANESIVRDIFFYFKSTTRRNTSRRLLFPLGRVSHPDSLKGPDSSRRTRSAVAPCGGGGCPLGWSEKTVSQCSRPIMMVYWLTSLRTLNDIDT